MKFTILPVALLASSAICATDAETYEFISPSATDRRSPCPMVNTLANHGYLSRDGLNISMSDLVTAFNLSVNLESAATQLVGAKALLTSTTGNASTFNLDDLDEHGVIEHDGSLSRADIYFGDNHSFNATIWDSVAALFNETQSESCYLYRRLSFLPVHLTMLMNFRSPARNSHPSPQRSSRSRCRGQPGVQHELQRRNV